MDTTVDDTMLWSGSHKSHNESLRCVLETAENYLNLHKIKCEISTKEILF